MILSLFGSRRGDSSPQAMDVVMGECPGEDSKENQPGFIVLAEPNMAVNQSRALRDLVLDWPQDDMDHTVSDADWSSGGSDFESEGLADRLAERIRLNTDGLYDS